MAYVSDLTSPATGDAAMRRFKDQVVAAGGHVMASGDGVSAYGATSDVITADSGANSFANYTSGSSSAWCRLRVGAGPREVLIVRGSASTTWSLKYSVIGFTGGSPSATAAPTATDSQTDGPAQLFPTNGTYRLLICAEDAAPYYLGMNTFLFGGGTPLTALHLWPLRAGSYPAADTDPYVLLVDYASPPCTQSRLLSVAAGGAKAWAKPGLTGAAWDYCQLAAPYAVVPPVNSTALMLHPITGEELPIEIPAVIIGSGPAYRGPKGYVRDARYCMSHTSVTPYGTHIAYAGRYWIRIGDLFVPWGSTPPAL